MRIFLIPFLFLFSGFIQAQTPVDTVKTELGDVIIYSNRTWKYVADETFDGILNEALFERIQKDSTLNLEQNWDTEVCYTSDLRNDLSKLKDTIPIWILNNEHKDFIVPAKGIVTSRYGFRKGRYHNGIDLDLETGDTVVAAWDGKVRYAKWNDGGFGNLVIIRHYNGLETFYAHLSKHLVSPNQEVKAGEPIGLGGNTGHSFGSHLHFEVRFYDAAMNPEEILDFANKKVKDDTLLVHKAIFRPGAKPTDATEGGEGVASVQQQAAVTATRKYYKVRPGDTLSAIASRHNTTVSKLCQLNGIRPTTTIQVGRQLRVK